MVDTGNLSNNDLIDVTTVEDIYGRRKPPIARLKEKLKAAGGADLNAIGSIRMDLTFGDMSQPYYKEMVIVKGLGVPAILSARTIKEMSMIIDLNRGIASIGPYGHRVRLKPLMNKGEKRRNRPQEEIQVKPSYINEKQNGLLAYALSGAIIPPHSSVVLPVRNTKLVKGGDEVYFAQDEQVFGRKKLISLDTISTIHSRQNKLCFLIPVINTTDQYRKIKPGKRVGKFTIIEKPQIDYSTRTSTPVRKKSDPNACKRSASPSLERGVYKIKRVTSPVPFSLISDGLSNVYHVKPNNKALQEPLKLPKIPPLESLKTTQQIQDALTLFLELKEVKCANKNNLIYNHIKELTNYQVDKNEDLSKSEKDQLYFLLAQFYDIISKSQYDVGKTTLIEFVVDTGDNAPVKHKTRPLNPAMVEVLQKHLAEQVKEGIIAPGDGPWASPIVPVLKESGAWRFAVDYRDLNSLTKTDSYPIAHHLMATASEEFRKAKYFISLDLAGAYLAVPVEEESQDKLAMTTCEGLFKCLRMPFGAKNACGCYARLMRIIFNDMMERRESMSFFDDHLIPCPTFKDGLFRLAKFLYAIRKANLRISPSKSKFFVQKVEWLGVEATAGHLLPAGKHIEKVKKWPTPQSPTEIKSFLGLAGYHRKFIKDYAKITKHLNEMSAAEDPNKPSRRRKGQNPDSDENPSKPKKKFEWTTECQVEFDELRKRLTSQPVLVHPNFSSKHPFILNTDASDWAIGAELSQKQDDGTERAVAYASKLLSQAERNYSTTRKELLAVVHFIYHFKYFLLGRPFVVRTDHSALQWLRTSHNLTGQLYRWSAEISDYDFEIQHRPGRKHQNADALSRYPYPGRDKTITSALTSLDKEMYQKCGVKPPKTGSLGKKLHADVYVTTRSQKALLERETGDFSESDEESENGFLREPALESRSFEQNNESPISSQSETAQEIIPPENSVPIGNENFGFGKSNPVQIQYDMLEEQKKDPILRKIYGWILRKTRPHDLSKLDPNFEKPYAMLYDNLRLIDGKIYVLDDDRFKICIPSHLIPEIIKTLHQHPLAGHMGINKTIKQAQNSFYWPKLPQIIERAVKSCASCIKAKKRKPEKHVPMGQTSSAEIQRLRHFYADLVGPWIPQPMIGKNQYLLTLIDAVTGYPEAYPLPRATSEHIIRVLIRDFIPRYGVGMRLTTDNGTQFKSQLFQEVCDRLGVIRMTTQPYEPHTNPVERLHSTIETTIRAQMAQDGNNTTLNWDSYIPGALAAIRQSPTRDNKYSPHYLLFGEEPVIPAQVLTGHIDPKIGSKDAIQQLEILKQNLDDVYASKLKRHLLNKKHYDKRVKLSPIKAGSWVYVHQQNDPSGLGSLRKTSIHRRGPYQVAEILNERQLRIYLPGAQKGKPPPTEIVSRDRCYEAGPWDLSVQPTPLDYTQGLRHRLPNSVHQQNFKASDTVRQFGKYPDFDPLYDTFQCPQAMVSQQINPLPEPNLALKESMANQQVAVKQAVPQPSVLSPQGLEAKPQRKEAISTNNAEPQRKEAVGTEAEHKNKTFVESGNSPIPTYANSSVSPIKSYTNSATSPAIVIPKQIQNVRELPQYPSARYLDALRLEIPQVMDLSPVEQQSLLLQNNQQALTHSPMEATVNTELEAREYPSIQYQPQDLTTSSATYPGQGHQVNYPVQQASTALEPQPQWQYPAYQGYHWGQSPEIQYHQRQLPYQVSNQMSNQVSSYLTPRHCSYEPRSLNYEGNSQTSEEMSQPSETRQIEHEARNQLTYQTPDAQGYPAIQGPSGHGSPSGAPTSQGWISPHVHHPQHQQSPVVTTPGGSSWVSPAPQTGNPQLDYQARPALTYHHSPHSQVETAQTAQDLGTTNPEAQEEFPATQEDHSSTPSPLPIRVSFPQNPCLIKDLPDWSVKSPSGEGTARVGPAAATRQQTRLQRTAIKDSEEWLERHREEKNAKNYRQRHAHMKKDRNSRIDHHRQMYRAAKNDSSNPPLSPYAIPAQSLHPRAPENTIFENSLRDWSIPPGGKRAAEAVNSAHPLGTHLVNRYAKMRESFRMSCGSTAKRRHGLRPVSPPAGSYSFFVAEKLDARLPSRYRPVKWKAGSYFESGPASV